jgi:hypothetical protein
MTAPSPLSTTSCHLQDDDQSMRGVAPKKQRSVSEKTNGNSGNDQQQQQQQLAVSKEAEPRDIVRWNDGRIGGSFDMMSRDVQFMIWYSHP